jgi:hypothetical protein
MPGPRNAGAGRPRAVRGSSSRFGPTDALARGPGLPGDRSERVLDAPGRGHGKRAGRHHGGPGRATHPWGNGEAFTQHWKIAVQSDDPAQAIEALNAAELRLPYVLENGRELSEEDADYDTADYDFYRPNYTAVDVTVPCVWMDCKGGMFPHMARTALRIVAAELRKAGVRQAHLFTPPAEDLPASWQ